MQATTLSNPFVMMTDPETILLAVERSERLNRLSRKVYRPLDRPLIPKVGAKDLSASDNEIDSPIAAAGLPGPGPDLALPAGAAFDDHTVLARIEGPRLLANYLPVDETFLDATPFQTFRVRFRLHNAGTTPITVTPWLEFRSKLGSGFAVVPAQPELGIPLHLNREWVPALGHGGGTMQGPLGEDIALADFRIGTEGGLALVGHRSMGDNPARSVTLPSDPYT